jgi:hypothetical protein
MLCNKTSHLCQYQTLYHESMSYGFTSSPIYLHTTSDRLLPIDSERRPLADLVFIRFPSTE